jgi:hypothetical protein
LVTKLKPTSAADLAELGAKHSRVPKLKSDLVGRAVIAPGLDDCKHYMIVTRCPERHGHLIGVCQQPGCGRTVDYTILQEGVPILSRAFDAKLPHCMTFECFDRAKASASKGGKKPRTQAPPEGL